MSSGDKRGEQYVVGPATDFPPGSRRIVSVAGRAIGVFNVDGELFAVRNRCPHRGAPLCLGVLTDLVVPRFEGDEPPGRDTERHGEILRCPWHAWEFDLRTGEAIIGSGWRVGTYRTFVRDANGPAEGDACEVPDAAEMFPVKIDDGVVVVEVRR